MDPYWTIISGVLSHGRGRSKLTIDRRTTGDHWIALALGIYQNGSVLIKSRRFRVGPYVINCSRNNKLTIKRPARTVFEKVGKVGEIEWHLIAKDTKKTARTPKIPTTSDP